LIDPVIEMAKKTPPSPYRPGTFGPADSFFADHRASRTDPKEDNGR